MTIITGRMSLFRNVRTFESLAVRDFRLLWLGQMSTSMGQWMDQVSRTWLIYDITHSPFQLGAVSAVRGIPLLLFGIVAGIAADRWGRKAQLVIAQALNVPLNLSLAILILTGHLEPWHIYVTGFLTGTVQAFQQPARQVLISDLVEDKQLLNAIALNSAAFNVSRSLGPAICGLLIDAFGVDVAYFAQAGIYAIATLWTIQIRVPQTAASLAYSVSSASQSMFQSAKEGFAYILSQRLILGLIVLGLAPMILGMPYSSLMPIFAVDVFHGGAGTQGLLLMTRGIGALLGALAIASIGRRQRSGKLLVIAASGFAFSLILFSRSPAVSMAMVFTATAGFFNTSYNSQTQTALLMLVPGELRGRVMGVYLLNRGLMPLGSLMAGALAGALGGPNAVTIMGISCLLLVVVTALLVPALWRHSLIPE